jgi:general secretion pathway protein G
MVVTAIIGVLASIVVPRYHALVDRAKVATASQDIRALEIDIATYYAGTNSYPPDLAAIGRATFLDPWGNPYQYLVTGSAPPGKSRKDRFLVPINSDFDLYSQGADGASVAPLTAKASRDDIIRANDGGFVGLAADY